MKYKYKKYFLQLTHAQILLAWMKRIRFKRFDNVSLYVIVKTLLQNLHKDEIIDRANGVAFNFIMAIFPAIIFLFTLIPYVSTVIPSINTSSIMEFLGEQLPPSMFEVIELTVLDIISNQRGGLLSLGFFFSLYLSTNGMIAHRHDQHDFERNEESRGNVLAR